MERHSNPLHTVPPAVAAQFARHDERFDGQFDQTITLIDPQRVDIDPGTSSVLPRRVGVDGWEDINVLAPPVDHNFWYADIEYLGGFRAESTESGIVFTGTATLPADASTWTLVKTGFGARIRYGLDPERIPESASGRWISAPFADLRGGLWGVTGTPDITTPDLVARCWMHLTQEIFQFTLGGELPLAKKSLPLPIIEEGNHGVEVHAAMPGAVTFPSLLLDDLNPADTLWARLTVWFDIQVQGAGSMIGGDASVILNAFQWPLQPA